MRTVGVELLFSGSRLEQCLVLLRLARRRPLSCCCCCLRARAAGDASNLTAAIGCRATTCAADSSSSRPHAAGRSCRRGALPRELVLVLVLMLLLLVLLVLLLLLSCRLSRACGGAHRGVAHRLVKAEVVPAHKRVDAAEAHSQCMGVCAWACGEAAARGRQQEAGSRWLTAGGWPWLEAAG